MTHVGASEARTRVVTRGWRLVGRPSARRLWWVVVDQAVCSLTNFGLTLIVARSATRSEFGAFSVAFLVAVLGITVTRGAVAQPLMIRANLDEAPDRAANEDVDGALGATALIGGALGLCAVVAGMSIGGAVGPSVVALGVGLPALLVQDAWRFVFIVRGAPLKAVVNDAVMLVLVLGGAFALRGASVPRLTIVWAGSALIACVAAAAQSTARLGISKAGAYFRRHVDLSGWLIAESLVQVGASYAAILLLGVAVGPVGVGSMRGAQALFGPFTMLLMGLVGGAVPEVRRMTDRTPSRLLPILWMSTALLVLGAVAQGALLIALPDRVGEEILGETWHGARDLVVPYCAITAGLAAASGALVGLRVTAAVRASLRLRLLASVVVIALVPIAGGLGGLSIGAWALAIAVWLNAVGAWWVLRRQQMGSRHGS